MGPDAMNARYLAGITAISAALWVIVGTGCQSIGAASGAAAGVATGAATTNPAIGIGVGIAVEAATDEAVRRTTRHLHQDQQDAIAAVVGALPVDESGAWRVKHWLPIENGRGRVRVTRAFATPLALCKDFVFSVAHGNGPEAHEDWYTASACQQGTRWKWADAEPAVARWGSLQQQ
ncbi:hypothetical protein C9I57_06145 [Trinickia symbiotica]|uniref:Uncharacterized protein n=2 Tax=Trinickia symbiotica TaxID=863227 RepID=A0A2T3XYR1_9BURK|nr:hypothetical protein C9I57_06145 [Trinickia symbiotica]